MDMKELEDRQVDAIADYLKGKKITMCLSGGIASIEMPKVARMLRRYGADVRAVMSDAAQKFITPLTMEWATGNKVVTTLDGTAQHIDLEDAVLVAPATLNTINKIAAGIADNPLTTTVASAMGRGIPIMLAPTMHMSLYENPILQKNLNEFRNNEDYNIHIIEPRFSEGKAKLAKLDEIVAATTRQLANGPLSGVDVLMTVGPNEANVDAVRKIKNTSSGDLGIRIAKDLYMRGANVKVTYGPGTVHPPGYLDVTDVKGPDEMMQAVEDELRRKDKNYRISIFNAAVLDYAPDKVIDEKVRSGDEMNVRLVPTKKIIKEVDKITEETGKKMYKVGFKLESKKSPEKLREIAYDSLQKNGCDLVIANDLSDIRVGKHIGYFIDTYRNYSTFNSKDHITHGLGEHLENYAMEMKHRWQSR